MFFFFKQKTAYEMRISDWSSTCALPILRPRGSSVSISRINSDGGEAFVQVTGVEQQIIAGDALVVASGSAGGAVNRVTLHGNVINAGPRPLPAAPTVRDLLGSIHDVKADTYLPMAEIGRAHV